MGRDKALLEWAGTDLLGHTLSRLRAVCDEVRILSGPERRYADRGVIVHPDAIKDAGPLAGLWTGLRKLPEGVALFLGTDLPLVPVALLARLLELAEAFDAVVPVSPAGPEPLCGVYAAACRKPIQDRIASGDFKMTAFWPEVRVRQVGPAELSDFGDPVWLFLNVNSPEDYRRARAGQG